jgi:hypothetical protein
MCSLTQKWWKTAEHEARLHRRDTPSSATPQYAHLFVVRPTRVDLVFFTDEVILIQLLRGRVRDRTWQYARGIVQVTGLALRLVGKQRWLHKLRGRRHGVPTAAKSTPVSPLYTCNHCT